jgi:hypothetical protein
MAHSKSPHGEGIHPAGRSASAAIRAAHTGTCSHTPKTDECPPWPPVSVAWAGRRCSCPLSPGVCYRSSRHSNPPWLRSHESGDVRPFSGPSSDTPEIAELIQVRRSHSGSVLDWAVPTPAQPGEPPSASSSACRWPRRYAVIKASDVMITTDRCCLLIKHPSALGADG